ncbi:MAG: alpha/beta hydrolase [Phycisphaerales bacterium]|nr:alpha/beta hydrolase [Phycisphaerales bacterium]
MSATPMRSNQPRLAERDERSEVELVGPSGVPVPASVWDIGEGRPVVFLSGLVGLNRHWEGVITRVCHRFRCVPVEVPLLELEGADCGVHGVRMMLETFMQKWLGEPAIFVGSSFGGHVALMLALDRPDLVSGLVLAGSSGLAEKPIVSETTKRDSYEWMQTKIAELFHDPDSMDTSDVERAFRELTDRKKARAMIKLSRSCRENHLGSELHRVQAPTLVLWGRQDIVTPPEAASEFAQKIPNARLHWIERCGHAPMIERPNEFASGLLEFVDSIPGG